MPETIKPLVSIIIPCFNHGKYLEDAVNSALHQSYDPIEIIIIDDGSTDKKTIRLLETFDNPKTTVFRNSNQGVSAARNFGIKESKGKFILPLDADDKISKNYISDAVSILETSPGIKIVTCKVKFFGYKFGIFNLAEPKIETLLGHNTIVVSSVFRRSDFDKTKGYNPNMKLGLEDWDFWLSLLENGGEVHRLPEVNFYYRIKPGSRNSNMSLELLKQLRRQIYENHKELYASHFFDPLNSFEYEIIANSFEYRVGRYILIPFRFLYNLLDTILIKFQ